jgi:hypothetical protein
MLDVNGQELRDRDLVQLLCEVIEVDESEGVRVRILNSEIELLIGCKRDEVLGLVADSELVKFDGPAPAVMSVDDQTDDDQADGVKLWPME